MPKIGDTVLYGASGACRIEGITTNDYGEYYVLVPLFLKRTKISVPKGNASLVSRMRPVPPEGETRSMLRKVLRQKTTWIEDENERKAEAKRIISGDDDAELVALIQSFYERKQTTLAAGKKFHVSDENILKNAEEKLHNEYAVVFGVDPEQVPMLIAQIADRDESPVRHLLRSTVK